MYIEFEIDDFLHESFKAELEILKTKYDLEDEKKAIIKRIATTASRYSHHIGDLLLDDLLVLADYELAFVDFYLWTKANIKNHSIDQAKLLYHDLEYDGYVIVDDDYITAVVSGTYDYQVTIDYMDGEITAMTCTCPYANDDRNCKHMAAVLYLLDEEDVEETKISYDHIGKDELIDFLQEQFEENHNLYQAFIVRFSPESIDVQDMKARYDRILRHHLGRDGFINYYQAPKFFSELDAYLGTLYDIKNQEMYATCLEIITYFTDDFDNIALDDSDGGTSLFYDDLLELLEALNEEADKETQEKLISWMDQVISNSDAWYLRERLYPLWSSQYSDASLLDQQINQIEKRLSLHNSQSNDKYWFNKELIHYMELRLERGDDFHEILNLVEPFKKNPMIYRWLIQISDERNHEELHLNFMNEAIEYAVNNRLYGLVNDVNKLRLAYYEKINDRDTYMIVLKELMISSRSLDYWKKYKELFKGNWQDERDQLLVAYINDRNWSILYEVYDFEEMSEELIDLIEKRFDINMADRYFNQLNHRYFDRLLKLYLTYLDRSIQVADSRKKYKQWIRVFKQVQSKFNEIEIFRQRLKQYRVMYKKRTAFLDELYKSNL